MPKPRTTRFNIPLEEYRARRAKTLRALKGATAVVFSGNPGDANPGRNPPDLNFFYLTGIEDEAAAAVLFDPSNPDPKRRCILFLRPVDPEFDRWDGIRPEIGAALKADSGFDTIMRTRALPHLLTRSAARSKRLACLHPFGPYTGPVTPDLDIFRKIEQSAGDATINIHKCEVLNTIRQGTYLSR